MHWRSKKQVEKNKTKQKIQLDEKKIQTSTPSPIHTCTLLFVPTTYEISFCWIIHCGLSICQKKNGENKLQHKKKKVLYKQYIQTWDTQTCSHSDTIIAPLPSRQIRSVLNAGGCEWTRLWLKSLHASSLSGSNDCRHNRGLDHSKYTVYTFLSDKQ